MPKYIPNSTFNLSLERIKTADAVVVCSQSPTTYFNAVNAPVWVTETAYVIGAVVKAPTDNNKAYECTIGGTTGATEPAWGTVQDGTFTDDTVTWKTHDNYSLAGASFAEGDKVISDKVGGGRQLVFAEKQGVISYRAGTVTHTAYLNTTDKTIEMITTATTTAIGDDAIIAGRTTIFHQVIVSLAIV